MNALESMVFENDVIMSAEATLLEAVSYRLKFGAHSGHSIGELSMKPTGRAYLQWVVDKSTINSNIKARAKLALDYAQLRMRQ